MISIPRSDSPATPRNCSIVRTFMENAWGQGDLSLLTDLVSADFVGHLPIGDHYGPEGARIDIQSWRHALPDLTVTVEDLIAEDEKVVCRFTLSGTHRGLFLGIPPSGHRVNLRGIGIERLEDGRIAESWVQIDIFPGTP